MFRRRGYDDSYDGFLSYSHAADGRLAPALQSGVERFATRWNQVRALKIFRDKTSLSANPSLWQHIERALERSAWFVLMASPQAAASPWVRREVEWWLRNRGTDRLLIVVTDGDLRWDDDIDGFDPESTDALPPMLLDAFRVEPLWVDARWAKSADQLSKVNPDLQDAVAGISSALRGIPKDELIGTAIREHRRTMRLARTAQLGLAVLLVASVAAALIAVVARNNAIGQARIATARQLAAISATALATNLDIAQLLAVRAYRTDQNAQTRAALLRAVTASPQLVRYLPFDAQVTAFAGSGDGTTVVAGLATGRVVRWRLAESAPQTVHTFASAVSSIAVSRDGDVLVASDDSSAALWQDGRGLSQIGLPGDHEPGAVTVSPSGHTAMVHTAEPGFRGSGGTVVVDVARDQVTASHPDATADESQFVSPVAVSDEEALLFGSLTGRWERRRISDWAVLASSGIDTGAHDFAVVASADGTTMTVSNGDPTISVFRTNEASDRDQPKFTALAPISAATALALSPDGSKVAVADSGAIYVSPVALTGTSRPTHTELVGNGSINQDGVLFFGDGSQLLSASVDRIAVWDLDQPDRIARTRGIPVQPGCNGCAGPDVSVSPDGRAIAAVDGFGETLVIQQLDTDAAPQRIAGSILDYSYGPPVWSGDGRFVALPVVPPAGGSDVQAPTGLPATVRAWRAGYGSDQIAGVTLASDGRSVILVNAQGQIRLHDADTGAVTRTVDGLHDTAAEDSSAGLGRGQVAINPTAQLIAMAGTESVSIVDMSDGEVRETIPGGDIRYVTYAGQRLLIQRANGSLEVWNDRGTVRERLLAGDESYVWPPVANQRGTLVARQRSNGSIVLDDLDSGATLASFAPTPAKTGTVFAPDGATMITVTEGDDGILTVRDLSEENLVRVACATAGRDLSPDEWQVFVGTAPPDDLHCR